MQAVRLMIAALLSQYFYTLPTRVFSLTQVTLSYNMPQMLAEFVGASGIITMYASALF